MLPRGTLRRIGLPGRREREEIRRGRQPRDERERAYVDAHQARLAERYRTRSQSPVSRQSSRYSSRRSRDCSRERSPPRRTRNSSRRSPSCDRYRARSLPRSTRDRSRMSQSHDRYRPRSARRTRRSPSRDRYRALLPLRGAPDTYRPRGSMRRSRSPRDSEQSRRKSPPHDGKYSLTPSRDSSSGRRSERSRHLEVGPLLQKPTTISGPYLCHFCDACNGGGSICEQEACLRDGTA
jgi:hypothetical protein